MSKKKGALANDPSTTGGSAKPKTRRGKGGVWVDQQGYRVDGYGRRLPGQKAPYDPPRGSRNNDNKKNKDPKVQDPTQITDPYTQNPESPWDQLTPDQRNNELDESMGGFMRGTIDQMHPYQAGSYQDEMNRARNAVMQDFNMQNQDVFARQEADFHQRAAEQGLDPSNPGYAAAYKAEVTDRQDRARQMAMNQAEQQAYNVDQQFYNQNYQNFLAPGAQFGQIADAYGNIQKNMYDWRTAQAELQNRMDIARMQGQNNIDVAQIQARNKGGGGGSSDNGPSLYERWQQGQIANGYPDKPNANIGNNVIIGGANGAGGQFVNNLNNNTKKS